MKEKLSLYDAYVTFHRCGRERIRVTQSTAISTTKITKCKMRTPCQMALVVFCLTILYCRRSTCLMYAFYEDMKAPLICGRKQTLALQANATEGL